MKPILFAVLLAGCTNQTGIELKVTAPSSSIQMGVASLEFLVSHQSFCERWVIDSGLGTGTRADVHARDLHASPYQLLIKPTHFTDLSEQVYAVAVALDGNGKPIGIASFGAHPFERGQVFEHSADVQLFDRQDASYVADGCVCVPGLPWMGNGSGQGCDLDVVPSFPRFQDTAGCELSQGRRELSGPVCDGQPYLAEVTDRRLPCFNASGGSCQVGVRNCADHDGRAYDAECVPMGGDPSLPTGALCNAYSECEKVACGDVIGCFTTAMLPATHNLNCTLHVDAATLKPCSDGKWELALPGFQGSSGAACVATMIEGREQPPLTVGWKGAKNGMDALSTQCPPTLVVESIAADPALPQTMTLVTTVGDQVLNVNLKIVRSCAQVVSSLSCG